MKDCPRNNIPVKIEKNRITKAKREPSETNSIPPHIFWETPKPIKIPIDNKMPKNMIKFPKLDGGDDSITTIYKNHTRIPAIAIIILIKNSPRNGNVSSSFPVFDGDEILISTNKGRVIRVAASDIRTVGRATQGHRIQKLSGDEKVVSANKIDDNLI